MKELLFRILREAGQVQKESFRKTHSIDIKESISSVVTEVDLRCDQIISDAIRREFPTHNILTEESGLTDHGSRFTWVIDPLDGTSNFAAGIPWFGVLIAFFENDLPILAGAYLPMHDLLYFAESGKGASLNGISLKIEHAVLRDSLVGFAIDYTEDVGFLNCGMNLYQLLIMNARNVRCTNSLVDLMMVADGSMGGSINMCTKIWDIAAPWLIIRESGGTMRDVYNQELKFELGEKHILQNYSIMAGFIPLLDEISIAQTKR